MLSWPLLVRRIHGPSMIPLLNPGEVIIGLRWYRRLRPGDLVVFRHESKELVKRIDRIDEAQLFVVGENIASSTDSRQFGAIPRRSVRARVITRVLRKRAS